MIHRTKTTIAALFVTAMSVAQPTSVFVHADQSLGEISPYVYGQFIEYMGRCIDGGIYDANSPLSRADGIREDVLEKVKELAPPLIRFPGGTFVKTFHWEDGVGPKDQRRASKNLIWGGINDFQFGTCEFIDYCRAVGAEPVLVVNLSTGSPDEAAHWVEYCNGTENTYYANLRRSHGYEEPFNVKYWALGNEEAAEPDAGRHQDPNRYVEDVWQFIKLMKLTDPSIQLIADGERGNPEWNRIILQGLDGAIDYISFHGYVDTSESPYSIFERINNVERELGEMHQTIQQFSTFPVENWKKWYRFPERTHPIQIALDEWGIWEKQEPPYGTTVTYEWRHALATAWYLHAILRQAANVGMANWAQMVNILAPIMTTPEASIRQTVFYPLREYRRQALGRSVRTTVESPVLTKENATDIHVIDAVAIVDSASASMTICLVNISPKEQEVNLHFDGIRAKDLKESTTLTSTSLNALNSYKTPEKPDVVTVSHTAPKGLPGSVKMPAESIMILRFSTR